MSTEDDIQFQRVVMEGLVPKVQDSAFCVSLCPTDESNRIDAKFCVELGVMIMLDKPIIAVIAPGAPLPRKLELVADKIVHADITTDAGRELLMEAINDLQSQTQ
jgi:hypothetical protein